MLAEQPLIQQGVKTIIVAPPVEADEISAWLADYKSVDDSPLFDIIAHEQELGPEFMARVGESLAEVIILHAGITGFRVESVRQLVELHGDRARLVLAFVPWMGDWFDVITQAGAITYQLPLRPEPFADLARELPRLMADVRNRHAQRALGDTVDVAEAILQIPEPEPQSRQPRPAAGVRLPTQVITSWSSKGGDGKSLVAQELAWQLANIGGHKVLLVDADMSRGYLAQALDKESRRFAERHNITTLAQEFLVSESISQEALSEHIYGVPDINHQAQSNLSIIFGITSPDAATLPAYSADHGVQGARFVNELVQRTIGMFEFVVFDIGTAITIPVHYAAIKAAGHLLVLATPFRPSVAPTREGIRQLESHQATTRDQLRLVINRWSPEALIKRDEIPDYLGIPLFATLPLVEEGSLMGLINQGNFISAAVWQDLRKYRAIQPFTIGIAALAENFVPGIISALKKQLELSGRKKKRGFILKRF